MIARHAKIFRISANAFKNLRNQINNYKYTAKNRAGFILDEDSPGRIVGRFFFTKMQRMKNTDPETLIEEVVEQPVMLSCTFTASASTSMIWCNERRSDLNQLEDIFNGLEGVHCEIEDFASDVTSIYRGLRDEYGKVDLRTLRIKDYLGREGLLTTASFKLMEPGSEDDILRKYINDVQAFSATLMVDVGRVSINVSKKGSVRASEEIPEDIIDYALAGLARFHEEVEVETVAI